MEIMIWTCIIGFSNLYMMAQLSTFDNKTKKFWGLFLLAVISMCGGFFSQLCFVYDVNIGNGIALGQLIKTIYIISVFIVVGSLIQGGIVRMILITIISDTVLMLGELLESVIYYGLVQRDQMGKYLPNVYENFELQSALLLVAYIIVCVAPTKFYRKLRTVHLEKRMLAKILAIIYVCGIISTQIRMFSAVKTSTDNFIVLLIFLGTFLIGIIILFLRERNLLYRQQNMYLLLQEQLIAEQYKLQEEQFLMMRRMRHDIRKHLDAISYFSRGDLPEQYSDQIEEYRNDLQEMYRNLSYGDYCGRLEVNASIYQLEKFCDENAVGFSAQLRNLNFAMLSSEELMHIFSDMVTWILEEFPNRNDTENDASELWIRVDGESASGVEICTIQGNFVQKKGRKRSGDNAVGRIEEIVKKHDGFVSVNQEEVLCKITVGWKTVKQ